MPTTVAETTYGEKNAARASTNPGKNGTRTGRMKT
jgi:hypothetical protein